MSKLGPLVMCRLVTSMMDTLDDPPQSSKTSVYCPRFVLLWAVRKDIMLSNFCWWNGHRSEAPDPNNLLDGL